MSEKQAYGAHCSVCGEIWDAFHVPLPLELALRQMKASRSCWKCHSKKVFIVMPEQYAAMKAEKGV